MERAEPLRCVFFFLKLDEVIFEFLEIILEKTRKAVRFGVLS